MDLRAEIVNLVHKCLRVSKPVMSPSLEPIVGQHDGYVNIATREVGNQYNNWSLKYLKVIKSLGEITDNEIDSYLGKVRLSRPSI